MKKKGYAQWLISVKHVQGVNKMNSIVQRKRLLKKAMVPFFDKLSKTAKCFSSLAYKGLFHFEWLIDNPENFDHEIDLYYQWDKKCMPYWLERGVYNVQALKMFKRPIVIELCCGDGFNAKHFYATSAVKVLACDFDEEIIKTAKKKNQRKNIIFKVGDIRNKMSGIFGEKICGGVTNVIWDAAIEHFTPTEINNILMEIKQILSVKKGILSGYTIVEKGNSKQLKQHEYEFENMKDLYQFFTPYFKNVYVFETIYTERHNLYFYASDGPIPFGADWVHGLRSEV